jgi:DNA recombination protein RmuC
VADLERKREEIDRLLAPMRTQLETLAKTTDEIERARVSAYADIQRHVDDLKKATASAERQTTTLATALRSTSVQGTWGQLALENVVAYAGMTEHCDFDLQATIASGGRPDLVVRLPGGGRLPVDAKAPTDGYRRWCEAGDDVERAAALDDQVTALRQHVRELVRRGYADDPENAVRLVVLFVPFEGLLSAAARHRPELFEEALDAGVLLATPVSLVGLLRTIACCHQQAALAREAAQIADVSKDLYDRVAKFAEHFGRVGSGLKTALGAYNEAVGSYEAKLRPMARRLEELAVPSAPDPRLDAPKPIEAVPRAMADVASDRR